MSQKVKIAEKLTKSLNKSKQVTKVTKGKKIKKVKKK